MKMCFIQNSLSFVTNVKCDLSNATNGILVINVTCNLKLAIRTNQKLSFFFSVKGYPTIPTTC